MGETLGAEAVGAIPVLFAGPLPGTGNGDISWTVAMVAWAGAMELQVQSSLGVCEEANLQHKSSCQPVLIISQGI